MRKWFSFPITEGKASRQAHCDLPEGRTSVNAGRKVFSGLRPTCTTNMPQQAGQNGR